MHLSLNIRIPGRYGPVAGRPVCVDLVFQNATKIRRPLLARAIRLPRSGNVFF